MSDPTAAAERPASEGRSTPDLSVITVNGVALVLEPEVELRKTVVRLAGHTPYRVGQVLNIDEGAWRPVLKLEPAFSELLGQPHDRQAITEAGVRAWRIRARRVLELS